MESLTGNVMVFTAVAAALGYLAGSIPFGLVLTALSGQGDIRNVGSGNIGATNVLRTGSKFLALMTLLLDGGKGATAMLLVAHLAPSENAQLIAAIVGGGAMLGHIFPVWLGFHGGKGVATYLGLLLAFCWPAGLMVCLVWLATALLSRYSSLAAIIAVLSAPVAMWSQDNYIGLQLATVAGLLVLFRHQENIRRLKAGTEPKIGAKSDG